jgi:deoxyribose-phosphate aldolase
MIPKLEPDLQAGNVREAIQAGMFALKHRCQAIIAAPALVSSLLTDKAVRGGQFNVIAAIDFPNGRNFALDKWKDVGKEVLSADGFEVMLSMGRLPAECRNEIRIVTEFIKGQINPLAEMRFVLRVFDRTQAEIEECLKGIAAYPPAMIRLDHRTSAPNTIIDLKKQIEAITLIRKHVATPIKVSGNLDFQALKELSNIQKVHRFGVSMSQAREIVNAVRKEEEKPRGKATESVPSASSTPAAPNGTLGLEQGQLGKEVT